MRLPFLFTFFSLSNLPQYGGHILKKGKTKSGVDVGAPSERVLGFIVSLRPFCYDRERRRSRRNYGICAVPPRSSSLTAIHTFVPLCGFYFFLLLSSFLFPFVFSFFPLTQKTRAVFPRGRIILLLPISVAGALCAFCAESIWAFFLTMFWACVLPLFFCHCPCSHAPLFRWLSQIIESLFTRRSFFVYWRL